jgi:hypothetical protein
MPARRGLAAPQAVDLLEQEGWRFKRSPRQARGNRGAIQRSVVDLSQRSGGMPLPERPRTLLEGVLQRDFRGVRVQTAGLEGLGVEAAAKGNTVYLQRKTLGNLERPQNLALLGHELTHVAAAGRAPSLQRQSDASGPGRAGLPLASLRLPRSLTALQRSPAAEEQVADRVESGLRSLLSSGGAGGSAPAQTLQPSRRSGDRSPVKPSLTRSQPMADTGGDLLQRMPLVPPRNGAVSNGSAGNGAGINGAGRTALGGVAPGGMVDLPGISSPENGSTQGGGGSIQRAVDSSLAQGISTQSMPVAQRMLINPSRQNGGSAPGTVDRPSGTEREEPYMFGEDSPTQQIQRSLTSSEQTESSSAMAEPGEEQPFQQEEDNQQDEPKWEELAERIYPILKRMLLVERERRPW